MKLFVVKKSASLRGEVLLPGDKSIAHRAVILSSLSAGKTLIENFPVNKDCLATIAAFKKLGIKIIRDGSRVTVFGRGLWGLRKPKGPIFISESGTTLRLMLGVLAGQDFKIKLTGAPSLSHRPMLRVAKPLRLMGAKIKGRRLGEEEYLPIEITGRELKSITYNMPVASAQVKSAILLAGLYAAGKTRVIEKEKSRDHTERMLKLFKAGVKVKGNNVVIEKSARLISPGKIHIPADLSSASFFLVAGAILPGSCVKIKGVSLNPTRSGALGVLKKMGADIKVTRSQSHQVTSEPAGDILVKASSLRGTTVKKDEIPSLIDELPVLMVAASLAKGRTIFRGTGELRVKETDRINSMFNNLKKMGARIKIAKRGKSEDIIIDGVKQLRGAKVESFGDHRTAMSMAVAGLAAKGNTYIDDVSCINKSFPGFIKAIQNLIR